MKVCITEKPSVAKDIAAILGANSRHEGYFEGNGYCVTWTFGHLCTLKEPHDYAQAWHSWSLGSLPMIPERFGIKLIDDKGIKKQFSVIESLVAKADEVINCGDAGQEGELIQRWVLQKAKCVKPVKRLWISSLTDESIKEGFKSLQPASNFDRLYYAGLSRAIGDWILGINGTRLYTLKYSQNRGGVLSIGRVQTPTLALIVSRQHEIENFVPHDYWELKTEYRDVVFNARSGRFESEEAGNDALERIKNFPLRITDFSEKKGKESPPRLFDLTSLQVECNKKYGFSAEKTLNLAQSLYEKKVTTYPRVDTTFLSDDIYSKVPGILAALSPYASLTAELSGKKLPKSKKVFDNSKVTDHHAIIPTNIDPVRCALSHDEKLAYHLIALRFIAAFYPDCEYLGKTVDADVAGIEFRATGKQIIVPGWRVVFNNDRTKDDESSREDDTQQVLPPFTVGESGQHNPSLKKKTTQPPKPYTEGTLLRAMETAGKLVDDDELRDALKENGIGRPSTRAAIIELLLKRRYIRKEKKNLVATDAGIALIGTIREELLKSARLTGLWENKLRKIERGEYEAATFLNELKDLIGQIVISVLSDNSSRIIDNSKPADEKKATKKPGGAKKLRAPRKITSFDKIKCPLCKKGHIIKGKTAFGCSEYRNGCRMLLPFAQYSETMSPTELNSYLKEHPYGK